MKRQKCALNQYQYTGRALSLALTARFVPSIYL